MLQEWELLTGQVLGAKGNTVPSWVPLERASAVLNLQVSVKFIILNSMYLRMVYYMILEGVVITHAMTNCNDDVLLSV